jgi:hypothetical protein
MTTEDFTTYTEVDPNGKLTVAAAKATGVDADRDEDVYLYKDFGANYFDALNINFEIFIASTSGAYALCGMAVANVVGTASSMGATDVGLFALKVSAAYYDLRFYRYTVASDVFVCSADTIYYCTLKRSAGSDTITCEIYSDAARTTLLDTLSLAGYGTATKWRYLYGFVNWHDHAATATDFDGYVQNLDVLVSGSGRYPLIGGHHIIDVVGGDE